ncbi:hypothetical protein [Pseudoxanthomonas sp. 10H]|uniref:hypothetical protein n=1 Tax=Pseudoxanthomonas sp. 10H TaxID=3242729 RepID=UPI0035578860
MGRECIVTVCITAGEGGETTRRDLGEFHAVWGKGVAIGRDGWCDISLPGLETVAAIVLAVSNHKLLYRAGSPGFAEACNHVRGQGIPDYDARVDNSVFAVGPYLVQFGERYEDLPRARDHAGG